MKKGDHRGRLKFPHDKFILMIVLDRSYMYLSNVDKCKCICYALNGCGVKK